MKSHRRKFILSSMASVASGLALASCSGGTPDKPSKSASVNKNIYKWKMSTAFPKNFPGSDLREKAMYYRFDSAYKLAINSVVWRQKERIENAVSYFNSFINNYKESEFLAEMETKMSELTEINNT